MNTNRVGMNELVSQMVEKYGYSKQDSEAVLSDLAQMISRHVADGMTVEIDGIGSFGAVEERDAQDNPVFRPVYRPGKAMREAGHYRTRLNAAREKRYQKAVVRMIYGMDPETAHTLLNSVYPIIADTQTFLVSADTMSEYYGLTKPYIYGILYRFGLTREKNPLLVRNIHRDGERSIVGYDMRVALALSVLMCFGRKSVLNSRAKSVYDTIKASDIGLRAMKKAAKLDRVPRKRRKKTVAEAAVISMPESEVAEPAAGE